MALMRQMVARYKEDMIPLASHDLKTAFARIAEIPWYADRWNGEAAEVIKRPGYTMARMWPGGDCDDKAIAMASVLELQGVPWRFVAAGRTEGKPPTHVFVEANLGEGWIPMDCTYPHNRPGWQMRDYPVRIVG
jgi:transglutaminase-like putative cysteine protease